MNNVLKSEADSLLRKFTLLKRSSEMFPKFCMHFQF